MRASGFRSASSRVLPPGAAQQSRMFDPLPTNSPTSCEASFWIATRPARNFRVRNKSPHCTRAALLRSSPFRRTTPDFSRDALTFGIGKTIETAGMLWLYRSIRFVSFAPYAAHQRSTSHAGCAYRSARKLEDSFELGGTESSLLRDSAWTTLRTPRAHSTCWLTLRRSAFANGAAERLRACFTSSTLS